MKKRTISQQKNNVKWAVSTVVLLALSSPVYSQITHPAPYCASAFDVNYNMFSSIKIKGTQLDFGAMGDFATTNEYLYYNTFVFPSLKKSDTATIEINTYAVNDMEPVYFALWIDFNQNNTFESSELVMQNANTTMGKLPTFGAAITSITKTITVPGSAATGTTRARLLRATNEADPFAAYNPTFELSPCNTVSMGNMGNTYDFNIVIAAGGSTGIAGNQPEYSAVSVYPNPAQAFIHIEWDNTRETDIDIYDMAGKLAKTIKKHKSSSPVDIADLRDGFYYIKGLSGKEVFFTKPLSILR